MVMEFKQVMKRVTCRLCHYEGNYDLMMGKDDGYLGLRIIVKCRQCGRAIYTRKPDEMQDYMREEVGQ